MNKQLEFLFKGERFDLYELQEHCNQFLALLVVIGFCLMATNTAFAWGDKCSNVVITLTNATADEIKVTKFEYYDYTAGKWRTESMFGVDGHQKIEPGKSWTKTQDLEHVKNDKTKFKVTYESHIGGTKWGPPVSKTTSDFTCADNIRKEVLIDIGQSPAALDVEGCTSQEATEIAEAIDWGADHWEEFESVLEDIRDWPVDIGNCLENRFKENGKVVCEKSMAGNCTSKDGPNNGWASALTKKCHMCPDFLAKVRGISGKANRQACYFALVTHEWGHTCERGHKTLEIIDDEAFNFWKSKHPDVTIILGDCGMK